MKHKLGAVYLLLLRQTICQEDPSQFLFKIDLLHQDKEGHEHHMDFHELLPKKLASFGLGGEDHLFEISKYY